MSDLEREILEIKALIERLRSLDNCFLVFGAVNHRYDIGPALSESGIKDFEREHQIVLPEDFRLYLQLVGNGSGRQVRPYPYDVDWANAGAGPHYGLHNLQDMGRSLVSGAFPFSSKMPLPTGGWHSFADDADIHGAMVMNSQGCSGQTHLIVNGDDYGRMWESIEWTEFRPLNLTFSQWMRKWAETEIERIVDRRKFQQF